MTKVTASDVVSFCAVIPATETGIRSWLDNGGEPEAAREGVRDWLSRYGTQPDAAFVLKSWLDAGGEREVVAAAVSDWLERYGERIDASYVLRAWLNAGGKWKRVKDTVVRWLARYDTEPDARHVLVAWLTASGPRSLVREHVTRWVKRYAGERKAGFVFRAWLARKGLLPPVLEPALHWLRAHWDSAEATPVLKLLAGRSDLPPAALREILVAARAQPEVEGALGRLVELDQHLLEPEVAAEVLAACEAVAGAVIAAPLPSRNNIALMARLFAVLGVDRTLRAALRPLFLAWLRHPSSYGASRSPESLPTLETEKHASLLCVTDALAAGALDMDRDRDALTRFWTWVATWDPEDREHVRIFLAERARERD
jgi:hypothetical protein